MRISTRGREIPFVPLLTHVWIRVRRWRTHVVPPASSGLLEKPRIQKTRLFASVTFTVILIISLQTTKSELCVSKSRREKAEQKHESTPLCNSCRAAFPITICGDSHPQEIYPRTLDASHHTRISSAMRASAARASITPNVWRRALHQYARIALPSASEGGK